MRPRSLSVILSLIASTSLGCHHSQTQPLAPTAVADCGSAPCDADGIPTIRVKVPPQKIVVEQGGANPESAEKGSSPAKRETSSGEEPRRSKPESAERSPNQELG